MAGDTYTISTAVFFHLEFELFGHFLLSRTAIHPFRLVLAGETGDIKCSTNVTTGAIFIAFFAPESASPTAIGAPHYFAVLRMIKHAHIPKHIYILRSAKAEF